MIRGRGGFLLDGMVAIAAAMLLTAPVSARDTGTRYTDPEYGYSVVAPPGWERKTDLPRPYVAFLGPVKNGFQPNFNIFSEPAANKTLAQYVKAARSAIASNKAIHLQSVKETTLDGAPARMLQSLVETGSHPPAANRQVVAVHGGRGYIVTFTAAPATIKRYLPLFTRVLASFHWQRQSGVSPGH